jgi:hypothetical protein
MFDEVKNAPQFPVGFINDELSEGIFTKVDNSPWKFFHFTGTSYMNAFPGTKPHSLPLSGRIANLAIFYSRTRYTEHNE